VFVNAVWQDGMGVKPYPRALQWLIDAALILSPIYAALASYALALRIGQYGWTDQRFWAVLVAVVLACHAVGYMVTALRVMGQWLAWLPRVNVALAGVVVLLAILANSPVLDPYRITVASQIARLHNGRATPDKLDVAELRFDSGRRGYRAAVALQRDPAMRTDPAALAKLTHVVARQQQQRWLTDAQQKRLAVSTIAALRAQITLAPGAVAPDDAWYGVVLASKLAVATGCSVRGADCVLLTPDLRGDGRHQVLLCALGAQVNATCQLFARDAQAQWKPVESLTFPPWHSGAAAAVQADLRSGRLQAQWPYWPDVQVAGIKAMVGSTWKFDPPPASSASSAPASH